MDFPAMNGVGHIDLTVTDGERSAQWWQQVMGFQLIGSGERPGHQKRNMNLPEELFHRPRW